MRETEISIVIPIGPTTEYINKTIESILAQSFCNYEVIGVYDVSKCEEFENICKVDKRFHAVMGNGKGAGAARNIGLKNARGKYIVFWDADDIFHYDVLNSAYSIMEKNFLDIVIWNVFEYDDITKEIHDNTTHFREELLPTQTVFSHCEASYIFNFTSGAPWNKMFNRAFLLNQKIEFMEQPRFNDIYFTLVALALAKRIGTCKEEKMLYRINNSKSLQGTREQGIEDVWKAFDMTQRRLEKEGLFWGYVRQSFLNYVLSCSISLIKIIESEVVFENFLNEMKKCRLLRMIEWEDIFEFQKEEYMYLKKIQKTSKAVLLEKRGEKAMSKPNNYPCKYPGEYFDLLYSQYSVEQIRLSKAYKIAMFVSTLWRKVLDVFWWR